MTHDTNYRSGGLLTHPRSFICRGCSKDHPHHQNKRNFHRPTTTTTPEDQQGVEIDVGWNQTDQQYEKEGISGIGTSTGIRPTTKRIS